MTLLLANCVASSAVAANTDPQIQRLGCEVAHKALKDPAGAASIVSEAHYAELASEVARSLSERDLNTLSRTVAGRDFLNKLEVALAGGATSTERNNQIEAIRAARLSAASNTAERATELIRQAAPPGPSNTQLLGKNLAGEIRRDMNTGAVLAYEILNQPMQEHRYSIASDTAANLDDQELHTLAKTPLGEALLKRMSGLLELPHGLTSAQGRRIQEALNPPFNSYANHVAQVQSNLYSQGLPTSAKGVQVFVVESLDQHADAVKRTISGMHGLGKDADVMLKSSSRHDRKYFDEHHDGKTRTIEECASFGLVSLAANLHAMRQEIKGLRDQVPADGKTRIVNMSWGQDTATLAPQIAKKVPVGSPAWESAAEVVAKDTGRKPTKEKVEQQLTDMIAEAMKKEAAEPDNLERTAKLLSELQVEVEAATKKGLLIVKAAGNSAATLGDESLAAAATAPVKGMLTVGAADLANTSKTADDSMAPESSPGADLAAPGVDLPVGMKNGKLTPASGTSFASPYVASVAALMVAANPKITATQIYDILLSGRVTRDLPGTTADGKGLLDPVKAVAEAKKLAGR
jgi:hypothetical protein